MIEFWVSGVPKGQPRPRAFSRGGHARVYTPGTAEEWKSQIAMAAKPYIPEKPIEGPLRVDINFRFPRPKSHFTKKGLRPDAPQWHTQKPDVDNLHKAALDCLTTIGFWKDDAQVCTSKVRKFYGNSGPSGALIRIDHAPEE